MRQAKAPHSLCLFAAEQAILKLQSRLDRTIDHINRELGVSRQGALHERLDQVTSEVTVLLHTVGIQPTVEDGKRVVRFPDVPLCERVDTLIKINEAEDAIQALEKEILEPEVPIANFTFNPEAPATVLMGAFAHYLEQLKA